MATRDSGILELFSSLGDLDVAKRVETTAQLIEALQTKQKEASEPSEDLKYSLKRLVRGLSSYRDGARQGFALGLTEVLNTFPVVSIREVFKLIQENLVVSSSATGPEERDVLFGKVFGLLAIIRSGRLTQTGSRAAAGTKKKEEEPDVAADIVKLLLEVATKKSFIAELAYQATAVLLSQIEKKKFEEHILPVFLPQLQADSATWSPETLTLAIHLHDLYQFNVSEHNGKWSSKNGGRIVQIENIKHLKHICKNSVYAHPKIHSLWDTLLPCLYAEKAEKDLLSKFWNEVVEGELFSSTHNTQYLGYQLVERVLAQAPAEHVSAVLTRAFIRRMLKDSSGSPYMQAAAKHAITGIAPLARRGSEVSLAVLMQLASANKQFDFFTKTRTMGELMKALDVKAVHTFTDYLKDVFYGDKNQKRKEKEGGDAMDEEGGKPAVKGAESSRLWALNKLNEMARARNVHKDEKWFLSLLRFFFYHAFYAPQTVDKKDARRKSTDPATGLLQAEGLLRVPSPALSDKTRSLCAERFIVLLGEVATLSPLGQKENRKNKEKENTAEEEEENKEDEEEDHHRNPFYDGQCADGELWVWKIAHFHTQLTASSSLRFLPQLSKEAKQLQAQILEVAEAIHKDEQKKLKKGNAAIDKDPNSARARGFAILLLFLHTYVIHDNELVGALEDLLECWKRLNVATTPKKKSKRKSKGGADDEEAMEVEGEEEPEPMAVLVDILISFLTKPSSQLRDLVTRTFRLFASQMTSSSCQALVEVVTGKRDSTLFGVEEGDEDDEEEVEEDEDEHDHEKDEEEEEDDDDEDEDDEKEDEEEDSDEDDDEDESKADTSMDTSKHKSSDSEEDDEEEELLDDAAMFKMDEKIVAVLKNMKEKKTNERDSRESIKHFKCRVLDLLEIFVKRQHDSHLIPELIGPLAAAVRDTVQNKHQLELSTKLAGFLRRLFKSKHYPKGAAQTESLHELLGTFVERAMHTKSISADLFSSGIFYIIKILLAGKPSADYKTSSFFDKVRTAHKEEEEDRLKRIAEEKEKKQAAAAAAAGTDAASTEKKEGEETTGGQKKRKRGDVKKSSKKEKEEVLDEATLERKTLVRRYKKNSIPAKDATPGQMSGGLDVDRVLYLLRIALRDFMTRNSTRLEPHLFTHFSQNFPKLSWMLAPDYLSYVTLARSTYLKHHIFVILSDLLKRPEATGEKGEGVVSALPHIREAFVAILKEQKQLKPDYVVATLQCLKQVVDVLQEKAKQEPAKIRAEVFVEKESKKFRQADQARKSLQEVLDALIQARRASQAICGHASKIYQALALPLPNELQKSQLSKQDRKKQRREEKKKRQEERDRKRFEKLAQKKLKYQLLAQQQAEGGVAAMDTDAPTPAPSTTPTAGTPTTPRKKEATANGGGKAKKGGKKGSNNGGKKKGKASPNKNKKKEKQQA